MHSPKIALGIIRWITAALMLQSCGMGIRPMGSPDTGSQIDNSVVINLTGSGFLSGATVTVSGVNCTNVIVHSAASLSCTLPSTKIAIANVVVTNPGGSHPSVNPGANFVKTIAATGSGNFTIPSGVTALKIELWGAGGGGGGGDHHSGEGAGGGGGGAYLIVNSLPVSGGQVISYSVGPGGQAGHENGGSDTTSDGTKGADTSITSPALTAHGGNGGQGNFSGEAGGTGGTAVGGDTNLSGSNGGNGNLAVSSGAGGNGANGGTGGSPGGAGHYTGYNGTSPGGGGGGTAVNVAFNGGTGGDGQIVFTYSIK